MPRPRKRSHASWPDQLVVAAVAATIVVVPLVVYLKVVPLDNELFGFWNGQRANFDFFSFYKSRLVIGLAAVSLTGLLAGIANGQSGLRQLPMVARLTFAGYAVLAIASAWGSPFWNVALNRFPDRYEGLFVLLSVHRHRPGVVRGVHHTGPSRAGRKVLCRVCDRRRDHRSPSVRGRRPAPRLPGDSASSSRRPTTRRPSNCSFPPRRARSTRRSSTTTMSAATPRSCCPSSLLSSSPARRRDRRGAWQAWRQWSSASCGWCRDRAPGSPAVCWRVQYSPSDCDPACACNGPSWLRRPAHSC